MSKVSKTIKAYVKKELSQDTPVKQNMAIFPSSAVGTTWTTNHDFVIPILGLSLDKGDNYNQRQGDIIKIHSLEYRCTFNNSVTGAFQGRCVLIYDKAPNNANTQVLDVFYTNTSGVAHLSAFNNDLNTRFRILADIPFTCVSQVIHAAAAGGNTKLVHIKKKFKVPLKVAYTYAATTGTITDIEVGRLFVALCSDNTQLTVIQGTGNITFTDA